MKAILDKLTPWQTFLGIVTGLITGAFALVYAYWEFSDRMTERQRIEREAENREQSEEIALMVRAMWVNDLRELRDSINVDHSYLMQKAYEKDSLLLIVLPRMMESVQDVRRKLTSIEAKVDVSKINAGEIRDDRIWQYLRDKEIQDSVYNRDAAIMRELRSINKHLMNQPKFGDRIK